jgi:DUF218 domain
MLRQMETDDLGSADWLVLVPGTSEQWGHHKAPPRDVEARGVFVSDEFAARLERGFNLLQTGVGRYLLISGGAVDENRPDYVEAERGRDYILATFLERWTHDEPLSDRILLDPYAKRSTTNVRNADKLADELGLHRILIVTTMPERATLKPSDMVTQGYYFLAHSISTFDSRSKSELGYTLGEFHQVQFATGDAVESAIAHCGFATTDLRGDAYGP